MAPKSSIPLHPNMVNIHENISIWMLEKQLHQCQNINIQYIGAILHWEFPLYIIPCWWYGRKVQQSTITFILSSTIINQTTSYKYAVKR